MIKNKLPHPRRTWVTDKNVLEVSIYLSICHCIKTTWFNASLYDIREYFQGRNDKGRMNARSTDENYTALLANLRESLKILAKKIEPKVYEYGFLKEKAP